MTTEKIAIVPVNPQGINQLVIDATISIDHNYVNRPTEYVVEDGVVISDHVRQTPEKITIEVVTTNSPVVVNIDNTGATQIREDNSNRKQLAFNTWLEYAGYEVNKQADSFPQQITSPQLLNVVTDLKVYSNMMITNLSMPQNKGTGDAIFATVTMQKQVFANTEFFTSPEVSELDGKAPNIENQAEKTSDFRKQQPEEVDDSSTLYDLTIGAIGDAKEPSGAQLTGATQ